MKQRRTSPAGPVNPGPRARACRAWHPSEMVGAGGFTLIELMVAIAIVTILLTVGVSSLTSVVAENRRVAEVNTLMGNLNFARAEAVFRAANVVVCPINPAKPTAGCSTLKTSMNAWQNGYGIFLESGDTPLRIQPATQSVRIATSVGRFTFESDGRATNATFTICDQRDTAATDAARSPDVVPPRQVVVSPVGRVRVVLPTSTEISCAP